MAVAPDDITRDGAALGRPVLGAAVVARDALKNSSPERLWALSDGEVGAAMRLLGALSSSIDAHLVAVMAEAKRRGLGSGDGWGPVDWARAMAPQLPTRTMTDMDTVAGAADELRLAEVFEAATDAADGDPADALPIGKAAQIVRFHTSIRGMADPSELEEVTSILLNSARGDDGLGERELATAVRHAGNVMRPDRLVEHDAEVRRAHRALVKSKGPMGMSRYTLMLDEEGAAVVDAAVDSLAKPQPDPETGEQDPRTPAARRADALLDLVGRAVGAPEGVPRQAKTSLVVTIGLDVLQGQRRGSGLTLAGEVLTTDTVRRLACDAQVIPMVLGSRGELLDQGMAERLFNRAQIRHLWIRDRGCTFPGCSKPAQWTDAHHLIHWTDGGPSDVGNAALLCRAHHTVVHSQRYAGRVVDGPSGPRVEWDLTTGSYDRGLEELRRAREGDRGGLSCGSVDGETSGSATSDLGPPRP